MPLVHSASKRAVGENIRREREAGKPQRQAIAIALNTQREARGAPRRSKVENSEHGPGNIPGKNEGGPTRQRHMMGEGEGGMKGGDFGVSMYPGRRTIGSHGDHMPHDGVHLGDHERAGPPALHMGDDKMHATAHSHHGPHHHDHEHHHRAPEGKRPHHVDGHKGHEKKRGKR